MKNQQNATAPNSSHELLEEALQPFQISVPQAVLDDLQVRLKRTRWPDQPENAGWNYGTNPDYLRELVGYWQNTFDWKKQEAYLNSFPHFKTTVDGIGLHYIYRKGEGKNSIPLLLTHGYPDSFTRFLKIIPLLTKADENGFSFDVVVPSTPGYGFSDISTEKGMNTKRIASLFAKLMTEELSYEKFVAHGGDTGSDVTEKLALYHGESLIGIHITDVPWEHEIAPLKNPSKAEKKFKEDSTKWSMAEGAYSMLQSTKPQTLAYGLNDSPVGLAAWIIEKFKSWSDCDGNIENCFTKDELLTNVTIYWVTQTINSAFRLYKEGADTLMNSMYNPLAKLNPFDKTGDKTEIPTAVALFPKDISSPPKEFAERFFNVIQWTEMSKGGHFAAMEQPELLAEDIRKFVTFVQVQPQPEGFLDSVLG